MRNLYTIGFAEKSLRTFVNHLRENQVTKVVDTRLNNISQLAGYAKKEDLTYILELVNIKYAHELDLAPTKEILEAIKKKQISWGEFEKIYIDLIAERKIERKIDVFLEKEEAVCFLCSEHKPHQCHRRLIAEYLREFNKDIQIHHLY
ncbi:DUF488 family protein [Paenibacillus aceris]|uniref:Uncharacterized protein (DUF488 family) n=1 Tax=Paenibacillus aceris TaxID=869555 RepID=A0ABS4HYU0_9BACL|nr:DUF488 domain-containing protein [Paenibacillus aceris]MBP1963847.1 uncharacterized protein (DUF488 family) [Paenibacillus aceris]NHW34731.1 DUF488 domain-containing protein [Paenibacillus aceris]